MKRLLRPRIVCAVAICLGLIVNQSAFAAPVPLSDLLADDAEITSGDKLFTDFEYNATEDMPAADAVNVIPIMDADGNYGVRFQGGFVDLPGGSPSDALITFKVTVTDPARSIIGANLAANVVAPTGGLGSVAESFLPDITDPDDVLYVASDTSLADSVTFMNPQKSFMVQKNILLTATPDGGHVTMSFVDQTFAQIPEPTSFALLATSILGFGLIRRRS